MSNLNTETVTSVRHWNETLFSFTTSRDPGFRFKNGHFTMIGLEQDGGRPLLRAANTGISAVVEPSGQIVQTTQLFDTQILSASISPSTELTLYVRYGDFFVGICGLVLVGCALITVKRPRSTASIPPSDAHQPQ